MEVKTTKVQGKDIQHKDIVFVNTNEMKLNILERIKILFGYPVSVHVEVYTMNDRVATVTSVVQLKVKDIYSSKAPKLYGVSLSDLKKEEKNIHNVFISLEGIGQNERKKLYKELGYKNPKISSAYFLHKHEEKGWIAFHSKSERFNKTEVTIDELKELNNSTK